MFLRNVNESLFSIYSSWVSMMLDKMPSFQKVGFLRSHENKKGPKGYTFFFFVCVGGGEEGVSKVPTNGQIFFYLRLDSWGILWHFGVHVYLLSSGFSKLIQLRAYTWKQGLKQPRKQCSKLKPSYEFHVEGLSNFNSSIEGLAQIQDVSPRKHNWSTKLILNLCMIYVVHASNTMWELICINHLTPLLVVSMPYACWFLWRFSKIQKCHSNPWIQLHTHLDWPLLDL